MMSHLSQDYYLGHSRYLLICYMGTIMSQIQEVWKLQSCDNNGDIPESLRDVPGLQWLDVFTYATDMWWQIYRNLYLWESRKCRSVCNNEAESSVCIVYTDNNAFYVSWGRRDGDMRETREEWPINEDGGSTLSPHVWPHTLQISQLLEGGRKGGVDKDLNIFLLQDTHTTNAAEMVTWGRWDGDMREMRWWHEGDERRVAQ